jgi:tetratricopeptide (TPR) repeat protein
MRYIYFLALVLLGLNASGQQTASQLFDEGTTLYEQGKYRESIEKYDAAIAVDKNHYSSYTNKALALFHLKEYEKSIEVSKFMLENFRNDPDNASVYISYGSCLDLLGRPEEALRIYDEGIKAFPKVGLLYFNKAITLYNMQKPAEAIEADKLSIIHNPYHASSHNVLSLVMKNNKIYSLMASLVFLAIEPASKRSTAHLKNVETILNANVKKTDENNISITLDQSLLEKSNGPDNFRPVEMIMSLGSALNHDDKFKNETAPQRLQRILELVISSLRENQKKEKGFGWQYYAPFLMDLEKEKYLETYCHIVYSNSNDDDNTSWLTVNKTKVEQFNTWFRAYSWNKKF